MTAIDSTDPSPATIVDVGDATIRFQWHETGSYVEFDAGSVDYDGVDEPTVGILGALASMDKDVLFWASGRRAVLCDALLVGSHANRAAWSIRLVAVGTGDQRFLSLEELGLDREEWEHADLQRIDRYRFWSFPDAFSAWVQELGLADPTRGLGLWDVDGGDVGVVLRERAATAEEQRREQQREEDRSRVAERAVSRERFVNPYTFVPFPDGELERRRPSGHERLREGNLSGWIDVAWTTVSPLLVRSSTGDTTFPRRNGVPVIPGSSIKGALRSLHETLAGGCLRIVDLDFVPSYREQAVVSNRDGWSLVVVDAVDDDDVPTTLTVCDKVVWIKATDLHSTIPPEGLMTGSTLNVENAASAEQVLGRWQLDAPVLMSGTGWVVLLTDAGPRTKSYWAAVGRCSERKVRLGDTAWVDYLHKVEGSEDLRRERLAAAKTTVEVEETTVEVKFNGELLGRRYRSTRALHRGEVLWARIGNETVVDLARGAIWRRLGSGAMRRRIPETLHPCPDPASLCPTCRIFGSADDRGGRTGGPAEVNAYRAHLRFTDGVATNKNVETIEALAPLGQPRPGAGQFYLDIDRGLGVATREGDRPIREWGASPDNPTPRNVRGRKFYWHGDPTKTARRRHVARKRRTGGMTPRVEVVPGDETFTTQIWFESLSAAELGGVIAALDPRLVLKAPGRWPNRPEDGVSRPETEIRSRFGGGKPLGLGTVEVTRCEVTVHTGESRYGPSPATPSVDIEGWVRKFRETVTEGVLATWPALAAALTDGYVNPERIWYPPADDWPKADNRLPERFDESFKFFAATTGERLAAGGRTVVPLPELPHDLDYVDQTLPTRPDRGGDG